MEHIGGCIPCDIRATGMVKISQEYKSVSRIQLRSNSLFIQRPTIWSPQMRTRNRNSGAILFRRFGQRRHTADHDWHHCIGRVVVTFHIKSVTAPSSPWGVVLLIVAMQHLLLSARVDAKSNGGRNNRFSTDRDLPLISPEGESRGHESICDAYVEWVTGELHAGI